MVSVGGTLYSFMPGGWFAPLTSGRLEIYRGTDIQDEPSYRMNMGSDIEVFAFDTTVEQEFAELLYLTTWSDHHYGLFGSNCTTMVRGSLDAAGIATNLRDELSSTDEPMVLLSTNLR